MASLTITIPDASVNDVQDALANRFGYTGINPVTQAAETKAQFVKRITANWLKQQYQLQKSEEATITARASSNSTTSAVDIN